MYLFRIYSVIEKWVTSVHYSVQPLVNRIAYNIFNSEVHWREICKTIYYERALFSLRLLQEELI
jgi:hypothetical protein